MAEQTETPNPEEVEGAETPSKSGRLRLLLLLLPVILLPASGGLFLAYSQYDGLASVMASVGSGGEEEEDVPEFGEFTVLEDLLINPSKSSGRRFLLVSIGLESQDAEVFAEITTKDVVVRDAILRTLGARTAEELASIEHRDVIKEELRTTINELLKGGKIERLYFTQYVLQ